MNAISISGRKVLVTGGAGFIGSELVRQLAAGGARSVLAVDNLVNGKRENLADVDSPAVRLEVADVRDGAAMERLLGGVDIVYHLACLGVRHSIHSPRENHDVNATATLDLLAGARAAGVKRFVYVSSSEVYGTARRVPITEEHPTYPMTVYGASKLAGETYTRAYWETWRFPTVVVRPFNSYGPRCHHEGDSGEVIPKFMLRAMTGKPMIVFGDGTQTRDFTFVEDTARAILLAGICEGVEGQTLNAGSGSEIQIGELALEVARAVGVDAPLIEHIEPRPGDVLRLLADSSRAAKALGFSPTVALGEGLKRLAAWYRSLGKSPEAMLEDEKIRNWEA